LRPGNYTVATLGLDDANGCAFHLWDAWQAPDRPSAGEFTLMRRAAEASLSVAGGPVGAGGLTVDLTLLLPSVTVVLVERIAAEAPDKQA